MSFFDGFTLLGTSPVNGGVAGLALFAPHLGSRSLSAVYSGDGKFFGSISETKTQFIASTAAASLASILDIPDENQLSISLIFKKSLESNL